MSALALTGAAVTMSSREIAELTGKELAHVHRDIRAMLDELKKDDPDLDHPREDLDARGYTVCFHLTRELTDTLLTGYSAVLRRRVIARWHELEARQAPQIPDFTNPVAAARAWADAVEKTQLQAIALEQQVAQLEAQRPAVEFVDRYVEAKSEKGFREVAKILGIKERKFISNLASDKIIFRQGSNWLPFAEHQHAGRFTVKTGEANGHAFLQCRFTPDGIAWVAKRYSTQA